MDRIKYEKRIVEKMIRLYCRKKEKNRELCSNCSQLLEYAHQRLDHCRYGQEKPSCRQCTTHCYKRDMREAVREVMRWAGPRMILYHPIDAIIHIFSK
ncbi:MAG: nitrous oxide-stimulated promoter family protein [Bacteroidaceae bacterium]|nr:nitrous oxide-stimulated promoter family protein [Bacteroidaceae bacterium]